MSSFDLNDIKRRMDGGVKSFQSELGGLRTGRASTSMLDPVTVDVYGSRMPLNQVATINAPEPRMLTVQVWDKGNVKAVEKGIAEAGLGLNPQTEGQLLRLPIPELSEERRKEMVKVAHKYAEAAKVSIRNVRRDGMEGLKKLQKDGHVSEDQVKRHEQEVQKETDAHIEKIDMALTAKEAEITKV